MNRRQLLVGVSTIILGLGIRSVTMAGEYFESAPEPVSPEATPEASPGAIGPIIDVDVRDVIARPWKYEESLVRFSGDIYEIRVAAPGFGYRTGSYDSPHLYRTQVMIAAHLPDGKTEFVVVAANFDPIGIVKDTTIEVVGSFANQHQEDKNGIWVWPLFIAQSIELAPHE